MTDDDIPTVDGDTFRDRVDDADPIEIDAPAEALTDTFDTVAEAVASSMWHTIIDGAGSETFVDDLSIDDLRDAEHALRSNGYASDGITLRDLYGDDPEPPDEGAAFFFGDDAADSYEGEVDEMVRIEREDDVDATGRGLAGIDGFVAERAPGLPSNIVVFVDVAALSRVPSGMRDPSIGLGSTPTITSPVVVKDEGGIAVVNIAE